MITANSWSVTQEATLVSTLLARLFIESPLALLVARNVMMLGLPGFGHCHSYQSGNLIHLDTRTLRGSLLLPGNDMPNGQAVRFLVDLVVNIFIL